MALKHPISGKPRIKINEERNPSSKKKYFQQNLQPLPGQTKTEKPDTRHKIIKTGINEKTHKHTLVKLHQSGVTAKKKRKMGLERGGPCS